MSTKTFPKSRVCVIDIYPFFEQGLKKAIEFSNKNGIHMNTSDGKKVIMGFCLEYIEKAYNETQSQYPKVLCMGSKAKNSILQAFIDKHFNTIMKHVPYSYCGNVSIQSPDLEAAAQNSLKQTKPERNYTALKLKMGMKKLIKKPTQ